MGVVKRQSIIASVFSYGGVLLGAINTLWLYTLFLKPEEIGLFKALLDISAMCAPFILVGVGQSINKYYPQIRNSEEQVKQFNFLIHLIPLIGLLIFLILFTTQQDLIIRKFKANSPLLVEYIWMIVPLTLALTLKTIYTSYARISYKIVFPKFLQDIGIRILISILIATYAGLQFSQNNLIIGFVIANCLTLVFLILYVFRLQKISFQFSLSKLPRKLIASILEYGGFIILAGIGTSMVARIDGIMLSSLLGLENTGIYAIALYMGTVIEIPRKTIGQISVPLIAEAWNDNNIGFLRKLYQKSAINQLIVGGFIFILIWTNIDNIFNIIPNSEIYKQGKYVVLFIGIAKLFDMLMGINAEIILMSKYYRMNIIIMIFLIIVAVALNYWLIPIYGITGAAIATAFSIFFYNILRFLLLLIKENLQPFNMKTLGGLTILAVLFALGSYFPNILSQQLLIYMDYEFINIIIRSVVILGSGSALFLYFNISEDINSTVLKIKNRIF